MTKNIENLFTIAAIIITAAATICLGGCASNFAPSLQTTPVVAQADAPEVTLEASGEIRMVVQMNGRDIVLPIGWEIDVITEDLLVIGHADGRVIEIAQSEDSHDDLMAIVAEHGEPARCGGSNCRADYSETADGELETTENGLVFHPAPASRVSAWTTGDRLITVTSPEGNPNRQVAIMLASDLTR